MRVLKQEADRHLVLTGFLSAVLLLAAALILAPGIEQSMRVKITDLSAVVLAVIATIAALHTASVLDRRGAGRGWLYIGLGTLAWTAGEALWTYYEVIRGVEAPFPSPADVFYLLAYPLLLMGILHLAMPRRSVARLRTLLDASIIVLLAAAPTWAYVIAPIVSSSDSTTLETVLSLSYPVGDLLLVFGLAVATLRRPLEHSGLILGTLAAGLTLFLLADFGFAILSQSDSFESGSFLDVMWCSGYALIAVSAIWQHRWRVVHDTTDTARVAAPWRQAIPLVLMLPAFFWAWSMPGEYASVWVSVLLLGALSLVVARSILGLTDVLALNRDLDDTAKRLETANQELSTNGRLLNKLLVEAVALSRRDSLTGLLNHASILDELSIALKDHPDGVHVAMIDVDNLKQTNDEGGHQAGDEALRAIARLLESQEDLVAGRYGGDEFLVYRVSSNGGLEAMERQMDAVVATLGAQGIGISHGIAAFPIDALGIDDLIERADQRLYRTKRARKLSLNRPRLAA